MSRYLRYYIGPVLTVVGVFSASFGGMWLWLVSALAFPLIALLDQLFPFDLDERPYRFPWILDIALYLSLPLAMYMFFGLFWLVGSGDTDALGYGAWLTSITGFDHVAARNDTAWYHYVIMFFGTAIGATAVGGLAGHELTHRTSRPFDLWLGRIAMALNWGIAFPIEHVYGHHAYVGTAKDPATAARGDSTYQHLPKAMKRTVVNAWEIEKARLAKIGKPFLSWHNVLLRMGMVSLATTAFAFYCAGWIGVAFHLAICLSTKFVLENLNYIEHYGLVRVPTAPVQPRHSWNCNHLVSGVLTYNLTRHSHHHADAQVHFQDLRAHAEQPMMPRGFMTAYLAALVPPLWRKLVAPKLLEWDRTQADRSEYTLIRKANEESGWPELQASVANSAGAVPGGAKSGLGY